ncbi:MAG: GNAT family N-acetyltransferase [Actinomycetota bacterium]|nr:GNAT family N-acetyltransferase [Actinomycetota bacterium]
MEVELSTDGERLAEMAASYLKADPFTTNVIGVHLAGVLSGVRRQDPDDLWAAVYDHGQVVGVAMYTPPRNLFVSHMPAPAAGALADAFLAKGVQLPGINGEVTAATAFCDTWTMRTGQPSQLQALIRMYRLARLTIPTEVPGVARPAGPEDAEVVKEWFVAFQHEAVPHHPPDHVAVLAERRLLGGELWLWMDDGRPVSLAGCSSAATGVARVGPVYTPLRYRRRGYGAAVTAVATERAQAAGAAHVVLYTDLANPTSNAVYRAIGYVPDHDGQERAFIGPVAD